MLLGILLGCVVPAAAQRGPARDSATVASYAHLLFELRDTVDVVSARVSDFRRDLRSVGDGTVLARSRRLAQSCETARVVLRDARLPLQRLPADQAIHAPRDSLGAAMHRLERRLEVECLQGLAPEGPGQRADTLRAWGPNRTSKLDQTITSYHAAAARLARVLGIDMSRP